MHLSSDRKRHILKTITYRLLAICVTVFAGYILTKDWRFSVGLTVLDQTTKSIIYYGHERIWYKFIRFKK